MLGALLFGPLLPPSFTSYLASRLIVPDRRGLSLIDDAQWRTVRH